MRHQQQAACGEQVEIAAYGLARHGQLLDQFADR